MHRTPAAHVVISGASSGIGQATAEAFAEQGARLLLAARNEDALNAIAKRCRAHGAEVLVVRTDVKHVEQVQALAASARSFLGRVDLWFGNVGVGAVGKFHEVPIEASAAVIHANLLGRMHDAHAAIPMFIEQGHGVFVNMISSGGFASTPFAAAYSASKFGQRGFYEALRAELSEYPQHPCLRCVPVLRRHTGFDTRRQLRGAARHRAAAHTRPAHRGRCGRAPAGSSTQHRGAGRGDLCNARRPCAGAACVGARHEPVIPALLCTVSTRGALQRQCVRAAHHCRRHRWWLPQACCGAAALDK